MASKLDQTYAHYLKELSAARSRVAEINAKLEALIEAGASTPDEARPASAQNGASHVEADNSHSLTERAFQIVSSLPDGKRLRRFDVGRALRSGGFEPKGKHFHVTLFKTLIRLKDQGRIGGEKADGVWQFFPKK